MFMQFPSRVTFRLIPVLAFAASCSIFSIAAEAQAPGGNVFFGYSYYNTDLSSIDRASTNGFEASLEGKVVPFLGFVADFDSHYGSQSFPICPVVPPGGGPSSCSSFSDGITEHNFL